jgi:hypothetical protein
MTPHASSGGHRAVVFNVFPQTKCNLHYDNDRNFSRAHGGISWFKKCLGWTMMVKVDCQLAGIENFMGD